MVSLADSYIQQNCARGSQGREFLPYHLCLLQTLDLLLGVLVIK